MYFVKSLETSMDENEAALDAMKMIRDIASSVNEDQVSSNASSDGENTGVNPPGKSSINENATNDVDNKAKESSNVTAQGNMI